MSDKKLSLEEIDSNFKVNEEVGESDVFFYDVKKPPFSIYGLYRAQEDGPFKRLPDEIGKNVNSGVAQLYFHTAGGRLRFATDSKYVALYVTFPRVHHHPHMPLTGSLGFDLYVDDPETGESRFCRTFIPPIKATDHFTSKISFPDKRMRYITINFPNYNDVSALMVGLQKDAALTEGMKYPDIPPIIFYGSSITQGGCASRPGNAYPNVVCRHLNRDFINFGFSGSSKGEDLMVDYMATLPMSIFVCDYDHNAPNADHLKQTHLKLYQKIRSAHPDVPFIMISKPDFNNTMTSLTGNVDRRNVIYDTYRYAREQGDFNVYFIDGESLFCGPNEDMCTVDGTHPNDYGFALMSEKVEQTIRRIFTRKHVVD